MATPSNVKYNGVETVPSNAGTYAITADFLPATTNYNSLTGASAGNFVIQKAGLAVLSVNNPSATYDGQPHAAVVAGPLPGTPSNVLYNGSAAVPAMPAPISSRRTTPRTTLANYTPSVANRPARW